MEEARGNIILWQIINLLYLGHNNFTKIISLHVAHSDLKNVIVVEI